MSTYHQRLRLVLETGHPETGPYSADDAQAEQEINERNLPGARPITEAEQAMRAGGKWTQYCERGEAKNPDGTFSNPAMQELMSAFTARTNEVNFMDAYWLDVLQRCVTEGSMGSGAAAQLQAWSDNIQSDAQRNLLGRPTVGDITYARSLPMPAEVLDARRARP